MWWKLILLTLYLVVLFVLSRILETVAYYEGGYIASRLLDPFSVSVRKLKTLLDQRGVSYAGVVEKQELTELVEATGEVSEGEIDAASLNEETPNSTNFTCSSHLYEEVEDTKDSVWLVQVIRDQSHMFMKEEEWKNLVRKVSRFGIRTGIFDCSLDQRLCEDRSWLTSRLFLALPQGYRAKDNVVLRNYTGSTRTQAVFDWVNTNLASRIKEFHNHHQVIEDWFRYHDLKRSTKVRVLLFSELQIPPMFYSVLSVKFAGRVKFGSINVKTSTGKNIVKKMNLKQIPTYLVVTPEGNLTYGKQTGEYLNYQSMSLFLKTLYPEVNDLFLLTLIMINMMCWFDLFVIPGNLFKRLGFLLWGIGKWNCVLILLWLPIIGIFQLPYMNTVLDYGLFCLRLVSRTALASCIRSDWLWYLSMHPIFIIGTFLAFAAIVGYLHHKYRGPDYLAAENNNNTDWWNLNWDSYMSYLFRPMATLTRPMNPHEMDLEVGMELLIERLAVPNFWLQPMINSDYVKDLPVWKYNGQTVESDIGSDTESLKFESDDGEGADSGCDSPPLSPLTSSMRKPYMFICEKCRALQRHLENPKSQQEIEQDQMATESACAKFLMDGNYKCSCHVNHGTDTLHSNGRHPLRRSPKRNRSQQFESSNRRVSEPTDDDYQMPIGMLPCTECAICLERYRFSVTLCGLPCGHSFHEQCIMGWLSRDNHCCPVCRWPTYKAKPCSMHQHVE